MFALLLYHGAKPVTTMLPDIDEKLVNHQMIDVRDPLSVFWSQLRHHFLAFCYQAGDG